MSLQSRKIALNDDTGFLKIVAVLTMFVDHIGSAFFPGLSWMRIIGRISFPLFAYCAAVGAIYTKNAAKYALRILVLAIISQPIYCLALNHINPLMTAVSFSPFAPQSALEWFWHSLRTMNILFTLLFGIILVWSLREKRYIASAAVVLATYLLSSNLSYSWRGVALIALMYALIERPVASFVWVAGFMVWWGITQGGSYQLWSVRFSSQLFAVMALPFIYIKTNTGVKGSKWFYFVYPAHLAAIYAARYFIER